MDIDFGMTSWRDVDRPVTPLDQPLDQKIKLELKPGHLPPSFVLLLWDGNALRGPMRFETQDQADQYLLMQPGVTKYLIIPTP